MSPVSEGLKRRFDNFISETNDRQFFFGLAEYLQFINKVKGLKLIVENVKKDEGLKREEDKLEYVKLLAEEELRETKSKVLGIIEEIRNNKEPIEVKRKKDFLVYGYLEVQKILKGLKPFEDRMAFSSIGKLGEVYHAMSEILTLLVICGYADEVKEWVEVSARNSKQVSAFKYGGRYRAYLKVKEDFERRRQVSIYEAWTKLNEIYFAVYDALAYRAKLISKKELVRLQHFDQLTSELDALWTRKLFSQANSYHLLNRENYSVFAKRVHIYLLEVLGKFSTREEGKTAAAIAQTPAIGKSEKNPYQSLIDVIDILLKKIEITPKNRLTGNQIKIHVSETTLPQSILGIEELAQILGKLKESGCIGTTFKDNGVVSLNVKMPNDKGGVDQYGSTFSIFEPKKGLLIKERERWIAEGGGDGQPSIEQIERPYCIIEDKWGFLKFNKQGQKTKIGTTNSQSFKLLKSLTEPFGIAKSVDVVFEAIREGVKYKSKHGVYTSEIDKAQKVKLVGYAIKEVQKENKLRGRLVFKWGNLKEKIWLEYLG